MTDTRIIIAGDSIGLGYLNTGPAPYEPTAKVQIWALQGDGSYAWNYMLPGANTGTPNNPTVWGLEVQEANDWLKVHPAETDHLWIVKDDLTVKGSTRLAVEWNPATGHMFASTTAATNAAMHNLDGSTYAFDHYDAAMIVLGTNDALSPVYASSYATNLAAFDVAAREAWHVTNLVESRIGDTMGAPADNLAVRQAQWSVDQSDPAMISFKTIGFELQPDLIHLDAVGLVALGHSMFAAWAAL